MHDSTQKNTFGLSVAPTALSRFASGLLLDHSPVALPEACTRPRSAKYAATVAVDFVPFIVLLVPSAARRAGPSPATSTKLRKLAGLDDVHIHDRRHTLASHAVMSGLDLYTVGRLLGHADTGSTDRYAHLADSHVRDAAARIGGIVDAAMTGGRKWEEACHGA